MSDLTEKAIDRVLELHKPHTAPTWFGRGTFCHHCQDVDNGGPVEYPCETVRTLEGENQ